MGFTDWIKQGVGLAGKHLINSVNSASGGLIGKLVNDGIDYANKNAGIIGKGLRIMGKNYLSDGVRNTLSNLTDKALEHMPDGNVKDTLTKLNNIAQGRNKRHGLTKRSKYKNKLLTEKQMNSAIQRMNKKEKENKNSKKGVNLQDAHEYFGDEY